MIEGIKRVKLLRTLKGTDSEGKPKYFYAGTEFFPQKKPLPQSILSELYQKRKGGSVLEVEYLPEPPPETLVKDPEVTDDAPEVTDDDPKVTSDDTPEVTDDVPKVTSDDASEKKSTRKTRRK